MLVACGGQKWCDVCVFTTLDSNKTLINNGINDLATTRDQLQKHGCSLHSRWCRFFGLLKWHKWLAMLICVIYSIKKCLFVPRELNQLVFFKKNLKYIWMKDITLPKTNIAPKNWWFPIRNLLFQGAPIFRGENAVSFREGNFKEHPLGEAQQCPGPPWEKMTYMVFGAALTRSWQKRFTDSVGMIWKELVWSWKSLQDLVRIGIWGSITLVWLFLYTWFCHCSEDERKEILGKSSSISLSGNLSVQKVTKKFKDQKRESTQSTQSKCYVCYVRSHSLNCPF